MELIRVGDKLISLSKIDQTVRQILDARANGHSQGDVAAQYRIDRAFVSHLESLGEVRKGRSIAVVGFPVANKPAIEARLAELGVDYMFLMTDQERRQFAETRSGVALVNELMQRANQVRQYDVVVLLASETRLKLLAALLDSNKEVIPLTLGKGPLNYDVEVDIEQLTTVVEACKNDILHHEPAM
jgi:hypothetical protein